MQEPTRLVPRLPAQPIGLSKEQIAERADNLAFSCNRDALQLAKVTVGEVMGRSVSLGDAVAILSMAKNFCWQPNVIQPWDGKPRRFAERELPKLHKGRVRRGLRVIGGSLHHGLAVALGSVLRVNAREDWDNDAA